MSGMVWLITAISQWLSWGHILYGFLHLLVHVGDKSDVSTRLSLSNRLAWAPHGSGHRICQNSQEQSHKIQAIFKSLLCSICCCLTDQHMLHGQTQSQRGRGLNRGKHCWLFVNMLQLGVASHTCFPTGIAASTLELNYNSLDHQLMWICTTDYGHLLYNLSHLRMLSPLRNTRVITTNVSNLTTF